jgi:branched-chain amino acid transport system permease protein
MAAVLSVLAIGPFLLDLTAQSFYMGTLQRAVAIAIAAVALDFILGYGGLVSLGQASLFAVGGYVVGVFCLATGDTVFGLPGTDQALILWPAAAVAGGVVGYAIGAVAVRAEGFSFLMITLGMGQLIYFVLTALSLDGKGNEARHPRPWLPVVDLAQPKSLYFVGLTILTFSCVGLQLLVRSPFGRTLRGARTSEQRLAALGHRPRVQRRRAFGLAGALTGLAGAISVTATPFLEPAMASWQNSGALVAIVVIGGHRSISGAVIGAFLYVGVQEVLSERTSAWPIYLGVGIIAVVLFAPGGIVARPIGSHSDE